MTRFSWWEWKKECAISLECWVLSISTEFIAYATMYMYGLRARVRMHVVCVTSYIHSFWFWATAYFTVVLLFYSCYFLFYIFFFVSFRFISFLSARSKWIDQHTHTNTTTDGQFLKRNAFAHSTYIIHILRNACNQFDLNQHRVNVTSWTRTCNNFSDSMFITINMQNEQLLKISDQFSQFIAILWLICIFSVNVYGSA